MATPASLLQLYYTMGLILFPLTMVSEDDEGLSGRPDTGRRGDHQADSSGRRKSISYRPLTIHGGAKSLRSGVPMRWSLGREDNEIMI